MFCVIIQNEGILDEMGLFMQDVVNIAVVDDLASDRESVRALLLGYAENHRLDWQITGFDSGEEFLLAAADSHFDAVFLDIVMNGIDGMETARRLRRDFPDMPLVFVTTEQDYAVEGYEVEAAGFLLKEHLSPDGRFERLMQRLSARIQLNQVIQLSDGNVSIQMPVNDIYYVEVLNHDMLLHTKSGTHLLRMTMTDMKKLLPDDGRFFECHRGIVINLDTIAALGSQVVTMKNRDTLPVSRRRRLGLEQAFADRSIARIRRTT